MVWHKGEPWRVVASLDKLNTQIRAAHPQAVPPATPVTSWGSIADDAHSTSSDHYPHYYAALGKTAVVCARDFPHAPQLGLDAHAIAEQLRRSRDSRIGYVISNRRITGPNHSWEWDRYDGTDPHDTHIHVSSVHTKAADDTRDWKIGDGPLMALTDKQQQEIYEVCHRLNTVPPWAPEGFTLLRGLETLWYTLVLGKSDQTWTGAQFRALLDAVKAVPGIDEARIDEIEAQLVAAVKQANGAAIADALRAGADAAEGAGTGA